MLKHECPRNECKQVVKAEDTKQLIKAIAEHISTNHMCQKAQLKAGSK